MSPRPSSHRELHARLAEPQDPGEGPRPIAAILPLVLARIVDRAGVDLSISPAIQGDALQLLAQYGTMNAKNPGSPASNPGPFLDRQCDPGGNPHSSRDRTHSTRLTSGE